MRGDKSPIVIVSPPCTRITPACAGIRTRFAAASNGSWDHPRMRGDKGVKRNADIRIMGSPPHARG